MANIEDFSKWKDRKNSESVSPEKTEIEFADIESRADAISYYFNIFTRQIKAAREYNNNEASKQGADNLDAALEILSNYFLTGEIRDLAPTPINQIRFIKNIKSTRDAFLYIREEIADKIDSLSGESLMSRKILEDSIKQSKELLAELDKILKFSDKDKPANDN